LQAQAIIPVWDTIQSPLPFGSHSKIPDAISTHLNWLNESVYNVTTPDAAQSRLQELLWYAIQIL
jgi:hypothetical protein